jgi:hypothetical protein
MVNLTPNLWQTENITNLVSALVKFQDLFNQSSLKKDATNPHLKNGYVSLDNLLNTVRPLLIECGLVITQDLSGESLITCIYHTSGEFRGSAMPFYPMSENRGTNLLQNIGGGITYAKRYALSALLGISVDTDDDANSVKNPPKSEPKAKDKKKVEDKNMPNLIQYAIDNHLTVDEILKSRDLTPSQIELLKNAL